MARSYDLRYKGKVKSDSNPNHFQIFRLNHGELLPNELGIAVEVDAQQ